jgi:uncharacterized protein YcaQ
MLREAREDNTVERLIARGEIVEVAIEGSSRRYLATPAFLRGRARGPDDVMRILGPLDALLWDRALLRHVFSFDYAWEVYKPKDKRRFGYYVCPLLHHGELVGRLEGKVVGSTLVISAVWQEHKNAVDPAALDATLERHAEACGASSTRRPRRFRANP